MEPSKIIIVEAESIFALAVQRDLIKMGYRVPVLVPSGEEALETFREHKPDLVLKAI